MTRNLQEANKRPLKNGHEIFDVHHKSLYPLAMKVIIIGATGLVGGGLTKLLLENSLINQV